MQGYLSFVRQLKNRATNLIVARLFSVFKGYRTKSVAILVPKIGK